VTSRVRVLLLGPLRVQVDDALVEVSGATPRRLLGLLASKAGTDVTSEWIIDGLWGDHPPTAPAATLQSHIARLRRSLGDRGVLETRPGGYRLLAETDIADFSADPSSGLGLWRGPAYDGLRDSDHLAHEGARLDEQRLEAVELRVARALARGEPGDAAAQLEALLDEQPTREPLWVLLVHTLYLEDRQDEALAAYQRARRVLRDELGVDPGEALRTMEHRVLTQDPALRPTPTVPEHATERRRVSVLVVESLSVADEDPEVADAARRRTRLRAVVEERGGRLLDSPGRSTYAVFGAPAHDDDPVRAVHAAEALLTAGIADRAGVATGLVLIEADGRPRPGAVAERAERLSRAATRGSVDADPTTRAALAGVAEIEVPFVGRAPELHRLGLVVDAARDGHHAQLATVVAEAGMGKSRLVDELLSSPSLAGVVCRRAVAPAYGEQAGLRVIAALIAADPGVPEDFASRHDAFERWQQQLRSSAAGQSLLVFVDDLHWADSLVTGFLEHLLTDHDGDPLTVLTAARPELFDRHPAWGRVAASAITLRLAPLTPVDATAVAAALAPARAERIAEEAGGVPLHVVELARLGGGSSQSAATLAGVLAARLDTLSSSARSTVVDAAVLGRRFVPSAVGAVSGRPLGEIREALEELVAREFVRRVAADPDGGERELEFTHDLVRAAAYDRLVRVEAARRHLLAAEWARDHGRDDAVIAHHALRAHDLAVTADAAAIRDPARALAAGAATRAGTAVLGFDTVTAIELLGRAVELTDDGLDHARSQCLLGQAFFDNGRFEDAAIALQAGLDGLAGTQDPLQLTSLQWQLWTYFALGRDLDAVVARTEALAEEIPGLVETVLAFGALASVSLIQQTPASQREAIRLADRAIELGVRIGCPERTGLARVVRGRARLGLGDADGMAEMDAAQADLERHEMGTYTVAFNIWRAGAEHHWSGPAAELATRRRLGRIAAERGLSYMVSFSVAEEIRALAELGRLREAIALADTVDPRDEAQPRWAVVQRALALADLGELDAATVERVRRTPPASDDDLRHVLGSALVEAVWEPARSAEVIAGLGDLTAYAERDGALELLPRLIRIGQDAGQSVVVEVPEGDTPLSRALAPHVRGLLTRSPADLATAADRWAALGFTVDAALARLDQAEALSVSDPQRDQVVDQATAALRPLEMRPWLARLGR
jgi:DNA-binding SARP family transcriptional activator